MSFVRGVLADYDAVRAGLTLQHNSGPVEGNVNRIKMIPVLSLSCSGVATAAA